MVVALLLLVLCLGALQWWHYHDLRARMDAGAGDRMTWHRSAIQSVSTQIAALAQTLDAKLAILPAPTEAVTEASHHLIEQLRGLDDLTAGLRDQAEALDRTITAQANAATVVHDDLRSQIAALETVIGRGAGQIRTLAMVTNRLEDVVPRVEAPLEHLQALGALTTRLRAHTDALTDQTADALADLRATAAETITAVRYVASVPTPTAVHLPVKVDGRTLLQQRLTARAQAQAAAIPELEPTNGRICTTL